MREIKFRAWYKDGVDGTKMREVSELRWSGRYGLTGGLKGGGSIPGAPLMQSTGVSGKDEADIYEGDVVAHGNRRWLVEFSVGMFVGRPLRAPGQRGRLRDQSEALAYLPAGMEVIGNIYENPELLKREGA